MTSATTAQRITQAHIDLAKLLVEASESIGDPVDPKYRALARAKPTPPWNVPFVQVPGLGPALDFRAPDWQGFNLREPAAALATGFSVIIGDLGQPHFVIKLTGGLAQRTKDANLHALNRLDLDVPDGMHDRFWEIRKMVADPEAALEASSPPPGPEGPAVRGSERR